MSVATPEVSVVMPVYNGADYILETIQSILNQTFTDFEIIVVDDGSTDRTLEVLDSIEDERLRVLRNERNMGITHTRNRAVSHANGEFIAVLDADDVALPSRLEVQVKFLRKHKDHAFAASWAEYVDVDLRKIQGMPIWMVPLPDECASSLLFFQNYICHSTVMLRASMLPQPVYRNLEPSEDYDLWVRLASRHKVAVLPQVLVLYRVHEQNVSKSRSIRQQETCIEIAREQLEHFGIPPTAEELRLHHRMFWEPAFPDMKILAEIRRWLDKIARANQQTGFYESAALQRTLEYQWAKACRRACGHNPFKVLRLFFSSYSRGNRIRLVRESVSFVYYHLKAVVAHSA